MSLLFYTGLDERSRIVVKNIQGEAVYVAKTWDEAIDISLEFNQLALAG